MSITPDQLAASGTEHGMQCAVFAWAASSGIPELTWLFAIPNGFYGSAAQKGKMKAEGLRSGVSDIMLPVLRINGNHWECCGLFIELKTEKHRRTKNGGLSDEQLEFSQFVTGQGYRFCVCYSWIEARDAILKYLGRG